MMKKAIFVLGVLVFFFFSVVPTNAQTKEPYRFGLAMPMTGGQALFGADLVQAALWAVEDINAKGGIKGRPLEAIVVDTQAEPKLGISMATRLADRKSVV